MSSHKLKEGSVWDVRKRGSTLPKPPAGLDWRELRTYVFRLVRKK